MNSDIEHELTQYAAHLGLEIFRISSWASIWDGIYSLRLMKAYKKDWWMFSTIHYEYVAEIKFDQTGGFHFTSWSHPEEVEKFIRKLTQLLNSPVY